MIYPDAKTVAAHPAQVKVTPPKHSFGNPFTCSVEEATELADRLVDAISAAHVENVKRGFYKPEEALGFAGENGILMRAKRLIRNLRGK